jgi:hypothetical protein
MATNTDFDGNNPTHQPSQPIEDRFGYAWAAALISALDTDLPVEVTAPMLRACASVHYADAHMDSIVARFHNDLGGFLQFLTDQWGWLVTYNPTEGTITADENKPYCVCPLVQKSPQAVSGTLCYCSEGFAKRMFSAVIGRPVKATVVQSVLRGAGSCIYSIQVP